MFRLFSTLSGRTKWILCTLGVSLIVVLALYVQNRAHARATSIPPTAAQEAECDTPAPPEAAPPPAPAGLAMTESCADGAASPPAPAASASPGAPR